MRLLVGWETGPQPNHFGLRCFGKHRLVGRIRRQLRDTGCDLIDDRFDLTDLRRSRTITASDLQQLLLKAILEQLQRIDRKRVENDLADGRTLVRVIRCLRNSVAKKKLQLLQPGDVLRQQVILTSPEQLRYF